jgi:hypothetical protein
MDTKRYTMRMARILRPIDTVLMLDARVSRLDPRCMISRLTFA